MSDERKLSPVEGAKRESNYLRGTISQELADGTDHFTDANEKLLKHFGTYQQDDRDSRALRRAEAGGKAYMFMVRTKLPGGMLTSDQLLAELDLGDELGNDTLRITSRQGLQLHGVLKDNLAKTIQRINEVQLSTLGACGAGAAEIGGGTVCHRPNPVRIAAPRPTVHARNSTASPTISNANAPARKASGKSLRSSSVTNLIHEAHRRLRIALLASPSSR